MKIITTVGTSIFTNKKENKAVRTAYKEIPENESADGWEEQSEAGNIKKLATATKHAWENNEDDSAEIKSILAIARELKEDVEVYLLATDTLLSRLACELVGEWFAKNYVEKEPAIDIKFNAQQDVIKGLQVENAPSFEKEGLVNLITRFYQLCGDYFGNVVINITGGYKAVIPYLTILGQVNKVPVKYIFEETDTLIEIPLLPLTIDNFLFEKYGKEFCLIETETSLRKQDHYRFVEDAASCLDVDVAGEATLNSLGFMLWEKYKSKYFFFYASDEVMTDIKNQPMIKKVISETFCEKPLRDFHIVCEGTHKTVFKQNHNVQRIYYFEDGNRVFIYKTFEDHDAHERYINDKKTRFVEQFKQRVIKDSTLQKIEKVQGGRS